MRAYWLREVQRAVELMIEANSSLHAFDLGTAANGAELSCVLMIVPKSAASAMLDKATQILPGSSIKKTTIAESSSAANSRAPQKESGRHENP